ncbi:MFS family permease [Bradyrhizobium diazoefficiens]
MSTSALAPFRIRNYRFQWPSDLLTSWAFEIETLVLGWYILVETGSVLLLTILASLQYVGTLVAPVLGMIGDRMGHRDLLVVLRLTYTALASTIMVLALTGRLAPLNVMIIVAIMGLIRSSDLGIRSALLADIMPAKQLVGAIGLSRTTQDSARIAGALTGAGLFAVLGIGLVYAAVASLYLVAAILMSCLTRPERTVATMDLPANSRAVSKLLDELKEGIVCAWNGPGMGAALCVAFLANLTAFPFTGGLLPYIAREIFHTDQTGLGYLSASFAVGSLIGSITLSLVGGLRIARLLIGATLAWYAMLLVFVEIRTMRGGHGLPRSRWHRPEHVDDIGRRDPDAHGERASARPCHGRPHDGDLRLAARIARGRQPDRPHRLFRDGLALCRLGVHRDGGDRGALARGPLAPARPRQCAMTGRPSPRTRAAARYRGW